MLYADLHRWLGWPEPQDAFEPPGAGVRVYAEFAKKKIQTAMEIAHPDVAISVGVIAADPHSASSEAPIALVCEFPRGASDEILDLAHRLAWNFSRTALLVTLEPHRLVGWSCLQDPSKSRRDRRICELPTPDGFQPTGSSEQQAVRDLLHWVNLITHRIQEKHPKQFPPDGRADTLLLKNLRYVRAELRKMKLDREPCHDLLARVIFTQFLFHRKDSGGHAFFSPRKIQRLVNIGVLSKPHDDLASVLSNKTDTYSLFRWMDTHFNGDLFPGKGAEDEAAWKKEREAVNKSHLDLLAQLIRGDLDVEDKQNLLWPFYSFDTIPLEFISSVYEEFLTADARESDKAYYTPAHLVDYVLDAVLPWNGNDWNLRILDPCCGSAIFLVKAFQRLIFRWRNAHNRDPRVSDLRPILESNLVGIDTNAEAVRVACFSLYLAMADAIEPKHYITRGNVKVFPHLRGSRLINADFFDDKADGVRNVLDDEKFDLVLGNAPWGDGSILPERFRNEPNATYRQRINNLPPTPAQTWSKENGWPIANNDVGPLFFAKAGNFAKSSGRVAMINTASLLYWRDGNAQELRKKLFGSYSFDEITNLSALRRELFTKAIGPSCIAVFSPKEPDEQQFLNYFTPKPLRLVGGKGGQTAATQGFTIEPYNVNTLTHLEAAELPYLWSTLSLGGRRDLSFVTRLLEFSTIGKLKENSQVVTRLGVIPGDRKKKLAESFKARRYFEATQFPDSVFMELDASQISLWENPVVDGKGSTDFEAFNNPQLLIKQSFVVKLGRFRAVIIKPVESEWGVVCKKTYLSVRDLDPGASNIRTACIVYNSRLAAYFLGLTSSRIGHYITETLTKELVNVPLPSGTPPDIAMLGSFAEIDEATRKMFDLNDAEWNLIEDFLDYTLPDALRKTPGLARQPTSRKNSKGINEPELTQYVQTFTQVVQGTFGKDKNVVTTIFNECDGRKLPVRMLTFHLDSAERKPLKINAIEADGLLDELAKFHTNQLKQKSRDSSGSGLGFQRVAYLFHPSRKNGNRVMNLTIVKPDERRYWTRSMAMRDADQLATAIAKVGRRESANK